MPLKLTFVIKRSKRYIVQLIQGLIANEKEEGLVCRNLRDIGQLNNSVTAR